MSGLMTVAIVVRAIAVSGQLDEAINTMVNNLRSGKEVLTLNVQMLVEPGREHYQPLAYGFMTQDDLARRFPDVATDFKAPY